MYCVIITNAAFVLLENLKELNSKEISEEDADKLGDIDVPVSKENEEKVWAFLQTRAALLLRAYETSEEVVLMS